MFELSYGAGYFPLPPNSTERFSIGYISADAGQPVKILRNYIGQNLMLQKHMI